MGEFEDFEFEFDGLGDLGEYQGGDPLETDEMPDIRSVLRRRAKHEMKAAMRTRELGEIMPVFEEGMTYHVVTRGNFDAFNFLPLVVERLGYVAEYWFTTWALNRENVVDMMMLFDAGNIGKIQAFVGTYLKRRETAVYGLLLTGLEERGQRMKAFRNHTKIQMMRTASMDIVVEGSANLTANGNCENFVVSCGAPGLFEFHAEWLGQMMEK